MATYQEKKLEFVKKELLVIFELLNRYVELKASLKSLHTQSFPITLSHKKLNKSS